MPFPWGRMPTLRQFLDTAKALGCKEISVLLFDQDGEPVSCRCLVGPNGLPYPLLGKRDDDMMTPTEIGSVERTLGIQTGFPSVP